MSKGLQIAIGAITCALLLGWYGYSNLGANSTFQYFQTLDELLVILSSDTDSAKLGPGLRVKGYVSNGTIERRVAEKHVRFAIQNDPPHATGNAAARLDVLYASLETPDLFQDGAEVVVEGHLEGRGKAAVFVADNVLAKCPSKFEAEAQANSGAARKPEAG